MKKLFLIPVMAMLFTVMAWGTEIVVNNFNDLKTALSSAGTADEVKLGQDITYEGTAVLDIQRSLTLDGQGHKLIGFIQTAIKTDGTSEKHWTSIAVNAGQFGSTTELDVTIKNLSLGNTTKNARYYGIVAFDGVKELTLDNINIVCSDYSAQQPLCFTGTSATPIDLTIIDSYIYAGKGAYPVYILKPINATLKNSTFEGYCALYFKYRATPMYGSVVGARGSVVNADACAFNAPNVHSGESNAFAVFPMEDDGITLNLNNCSFNAQQIGDQHQSWVSVQYRTRKNADHPITIKITGDNTHMYNINKDKIIDVTDDTWKNGYVSGAQDADLGTGYDITTSLTIEAGTFSLNPSTFAIEQGDGTVNAPVIDNTKYEINEVKQGGATLYRVAKKAAEKEPGVMYDLNDFVPVEGEGYGDNPVSSFDLSTGEEMTLNQETTTAGYVQVSDKGDDATVIKVGKVVSEEKVDQTLVINNGLDVQGESQVIVQAGSTIQIGEGGITTENPDNIVIEADEEGAASLIMDPAITVNQTPNLTVKMQAKGIGWIDFYGNGEKYYFWHRFALPIQQATTWQKNPNKSTYVFGWNYSTNDWEQLNALTLMEPFKGYTLTANYEAPDLDSLERQKIEYTFTGQLAGNTNNVLEFQRNGFNFFGNSYTGYIDILALVDQLMGDNKIDGTVWMWGSDQQYHAVPLQDLRENPGSYEAWQKEVAPMQTFILKQNGSTNATAELNYAAAVWGNPRYGNSTPAPARAIANDDIRMRIIVTADNGKSDFVMFTEANRFSDAFEKGYDGVKYMNERAINMYTTIDGEDYSNVATDNLIGKKLNIQTVNTLNYTISFAKVNGEEYALRDNVTGSIIAIRKGNTYTFSAQPNATIGGRFEIVNMDMVATQIENTEVNAGVKGIYTMLGQYVGEDFNALPAGVYVVDGVKIVK